jgi:uncharacterized delta-60 repeat protein
MNKLCISVIFVLLLLSTAFAQLDPTFGTNGIVKKDISDYDSALKTFILPDEKILILHQGYQSNLPTLNLVKFNANGSVDTSYGTNGVIPILLPFINSSTRVIYTASRQTDGKIILVGSDNSDGFVTRINDDGTLDTSFAVGGFDRPNFFNLHDFVSAIFMQAGGKFVVFGATKSVESSAPLPFFIRYNSNGSRDSTFGNGNGYVVSTNPSNCGIGNIGTSAVGVQSSGKFIVQASCSLVFRYNSDGTLDNTFQIELDRFSGYGKAVVAPDDKIVATGLSDREITDHLFRSGYDLTVRRFNSNGSVDTSFGTDGFVSADIASFQAEQESNVIIQPDGKILIVATTDISFNRSALVGQYISLLRLNTNGSIDGKTLIAPSSNFGNVTVLSNGNIINVATSRFEANNRTDLIVTRSTGVPLSTYHLHGVPYNYYDLFVGDLPKSMTSIFRPSNSLWYLGPYGSGKNFGLSTDIPVSSDFVGDFKSELAVFRPSNGTWYIAKPTGLPAQNFVAVPWGVSGDIPAPADFDGDGKSDVAVFRPSNGVWYTRNSSDNSPRAIQWGTNGDKPVTGDYDGDGFADLAVWRPSNGVWYIYQSSNNQPKFAAFGLAGDIPIQEDYDGDGKTDIGVWRPSTGIWYIIKSSDSNYLISAFGLPTDVPVPADYDGDLKTDVAVWRASQGRWYILNSANSSLSVIPYGFSTDIPLPARY